MDDQLSHRRQTPETFRDAVGCIGREGRGLSCATDVLSSAAKSLHQLELTTRLKNNVWIDFT